jgi:hypothetical protein
MPNLVTGTVIDTFMQATTKRGARAAIGLSNFAALTDAATVTPSVDDYDGGILATLSQATQLLNPTGTPANGQRYVVRIKSTVSRALTYDTQYRGSLELPLPAATSGASLTDYLVFMWNTADSKWDLVGKTFGF